MYEEILNTYDIIDEFETKDVYTQDVFEDPEFYGINYDEYEQLIIYKELVENPQAYDIDNFYDQFDEEMIENYKQLAKDELIRSGKLKDPDFIEVARKEGLGDIVDQLLSEMQQNENIQEESLQSELKN